MIGGTGSLLLRLDWFRSPRVVQFGSMTTMGQIEVPESEPDKVLQALSFVSTNQLLAVRLNQGNPDPARIRVCDFAEPDSVHEFVAAHPSHGIQLFAERRKESAERAVFRLKRHRSSGVMAKNSAWLCRAVVG